MLKPGLTGEKTLVVTAGDTAQAIGSGGLPVFATPCMIALMEATAMESVLPFLDEGHGTVGTALEASHTSATPIGLTVTCRSELTGVDGRRLSFRIDAFDEAGPIGTAAHERFIIDNERFLQKALAKGKG